MTGTDLQTRPNGNGTSAMAPMNLDPMTIATAFKESGMFPDLRSEAQAVVKIVAGQELGFGPMASMQAIQMIQGKPTVSANALAALVKKHPVYNYRSIEHTAEVCRLEFFEAGESTGISEFTIADAQRAGIAGGQNWRKYPKAMLFARALSQGVRWYAPDVTAGSPAYVPEELGAQVNSEGEAIEPEVVVAEQGPAIEGGEGEPSEPEPSEQLDEDRVKQIGNGISALGLTYKQIDQLLGAAGIDGLRAASGKALYERVSGLSEEQADALEVELRKEADRDV